MENISIDYHVLHPVASDPEKVNVLLVATLNSNIEERVKILADAGLEVVVVDVEPYALARAFLRSAKSEFKAEDAVALFDMSVDRLGLNVIQNDLLIYTHEEILGDNILAQLLRCLQIFSSSHFSSKITHVALSGDVANIVDFAPGLKTQLGIPVSIANPFSDLQNSSSFMVAAGLAWRGGST
jgi:type IV pilus assembly protein PilM